MVSETGSNRNIIGGVCVVAMCAAIGVAVFITKSAEPLWALFIVVFSPTTIGVKPPKPPQY